MSKREDIHTILEIWEEWEEEHDISIENTVLFDLAERLQLLIEQARAEGYQRGVEEGIEDALGGKAAEHYQEALKSQGAAEERERWAVWHDKQAAECLRIERMEDDAGGQAVMALTTEIHQKSAQAIRKSDDKEGG